MGKNLVLETDGSVIDDDEVLELFKSDVFILLNENEQWSPAVINDTAIIIGSYEPSINTSINPDNTPYQNHNLSPSTSKLLNTSTFAYQHHNLSPSTSELLNTPPSLSQPNTPSVQDRFRCFEIPFKELPEHIIESLEGKKKIMPSELTIVVHTILAGLRKISQTIPASVIGQTINKLTEIYPTTFQYRDTDGNIIDTTNSPLFIKFVNHANYENRPPKRNKLKVNLDIGDRKKIKPLADACSNWQPTEIPIGETEESLSQMKEWIKENSGPSMSKQIFDEAVEKMTKTFCIQRTFFNGKFKYAQVIDEWPQIFRKKMLFNHFAELTEKNFSKYFESFDDRTKKIVEHFEGKRNEKVKVSEQNSSDAFTDANGIVSISAFFDEDIHFLFKNFEVIFTSQVFFNYF